MPTNTGVFADLNDLILFVAVVDNAGFSAAGRALGISKSRLSKHVSQLEERLGVRLLQRTTRRFVVTATGQRFYRHCCAVLEEAHAAQEAIDAERAEPRGRVTLSCPEALARSMLAPLLPRFLAAYPKVQLQLMATNRRIDLLAEGVDIAIRVRSQRDADATFILREFGQSNLILVAGEQLWQQHSRPTSPQDLTHLPALLSNEDDAPQRWRLVDDDGNNEEVALSARLISGEFEVLLEAACAGVGIALLPESICAEALAAGRLQQLLPNWRGPQGMMHFVYPSRRGLLPGVRALVDFLAEHLPLLARQQHLPTASDNN